MGACVSPTAHAQKRLQENADVSIVSVFVVRDGECKPEDPNNRRQWDREVKVTSQCHAAMSTRWHRNCLYAQFVAEICQRHV